MNHEEVKIAVKKLCSLFPNIPLTVDQGKLLHVDLKGFTSREVLDAIREHRRKHEFLSIPKLFEEIRAVMRGDQRKARTFAPDQSFADIYRRQAPYLAQANDCQVILRVHRGWWHASSKSDGYRSNFGTSGKYNLIDIGIVTEEAERWAATIFDPDVRFFQQVLDEASQIANKRQEPTSAEVGVVA